MKTRYIVLAIFVVFMIVLLATCAPTQTGVNEDKYNPSDSACPNGMIYSRYPITRENIPNTDIGGFILRPSEGCKLPAQSCVFISQLYSGGLSCTPLYE